MNNFSGRACRKCMWNTGWAKKVSLKLLFISSPNTDRFQKFFQCYTQQEISIRWSLQIPDNLVASLHYKSLWAYFSGPPCTVKILCQKEITHYDSLEVHRCHQDILQCHCSTRNVADTVPCDSETCRMMDSKLHIHNTIRLYRVFQKNYTKFCSW